MHERHHESINEIIGFLDWRAYTACVESSSTSSHTFLRRLTGAMIGLIILFVALAPASSAPLTLIARTIFWTLHIGTGLLLAAFSAKCLVDYTSLPKDWRLIALSALLAVIVFAPCALFIESLFPTLTGDDDDSFLDFWAASGWWQGFW
ncbi:MAG: hypothetical protein AB8F65_07600 [Woeseiaceae bacterium]